MDLRRWSKRYDMVFANNAVYCGSDRYKMGDLEGVHVSGNVFEPLPATVSAKRNTAGRSADEDMIDVDNRNVFPTSDSAVTAAGETAHVAAADFNGTPRCGVADAGAYLSAAEGNPGWSVGPGFKDIGATDANLIFDAGPAGVSLDEKSMLRWQTQNVARVAASRVLSGPDGVPGSGSSDFGTADSTIAPVCEGESRSIPDSEAATVSSADSSRSETAAPQSPTPAQRP